MKPSERIEEIAQHVIRARFLTGSDAWLFATRVYLDEDKGYTLEPNHALHLAEKAAGIEALKQPDFTYGRKPGTLVCGIDSCVRPPGHLGPHLKAYPAGYPGAGRVD